MRRMSLVLTMAMAILAGCTPTPEPTRLVAEPPTTAVTATAIVASPSANTSAPTPTLATSSPYPAPDGAEQPEVGAYPAPALTATASSPQLLATPMPTVAVAQPSPEAATVTGVILLREASTGERPLAGARVFLARRLRDESGQPSFMVSLSRYDAPTALTDGEGRFALADVVPDGYALVIEFGTELRLARNLNDGRDVVVDAKAGMINDLGEIVVSPK